MISAREYERRVAAGATHVPLIKSLDRGALGEASPVDIYERMANTPHSYLLESADVNKRWGRYSFIGLACARRIEARDRAFEIWQDGERVARETCDDMIERVRQHWATFQVGAADDAPHYAPRFMGGLVGYFGYDTVRYIEPRLAGAPKKDTLNTPDILLLESHEVIAVDNWEKTASIVVHAAPTEGERAFEKACARIDEIEATLGALARRSASAKSMSEPSQAQAPQTRFTSSDFVSSYGEEAFKRSVEEARRYIIDGDVMQLVLSQRQSAPWTAPPLSLYRAMRALNPSPYMYYFHFGDHHVVGTSPEVLVRVEGEKVSARPIAGTRRRGRDAAEDARARAELQSDEKELAEHLMLIDLARNDLGRVCETASVRVTEQMVVEDYSHVMHMVSHVVGRRRADADAIDVLRACFPAGTVSGAPKIRAMELIAEMEPIKRGIYSGAVGYLAWTGNLDMAIALRTAVIKDEELHVQAGAGLVYDSLPDNEWAETMNKARIILQAASQAAANGK